MKEIEIFKNLNSELKMSSKEIAELTDKNHGHVKRDIENMFSQLDLDVSRFGYIYLDSMKREQAGYLLDKDLTLTLVSGYSIPLRHKIIKRWQELEKTKILSPAEQLLENAKMLVAIEKKQQEHELKLKQIEQLAIQANSYNSANTGFMTIRGFCNIHKIKQSMREAIQKGKEASALAKEYSIITKKAKDEMFGEVNVYPVELLEEVFGI